MSDSDDRYGMPPHGTRQRYRNVGCRCVACTRGTHGANLPTELRWPYRWLVAALGDQVEAWYSEEQIALWKDQGLGDFEADEVCILLGVFPHSVFPGFMEAGLDCDHYP